MCENFGAFLNTKRIKKKITLRKMADMLGVSATFLCDVEKDRCNPFDEEKLARAVRILELSDEEKRQMYSLAEGKESSKVNFSDNAKKDYGIHIPGTAAAIKAGEKEWNRMVEGLRRREGG